MLVISNTNPRQRRRFVEKYIFGKYFYIVSTEIDCYYRRSIIQIVISLESNQVVLFEKLSFE